MKIFTYKDNLQDGKVVFKCKAVNISKADELYFGYVGINPIKQAHIGCSIESCALSKGEQQILEA